MRQSISDKPVFVFSDGQGIRINLEDVVCITASHNHSIMVMADGTEHELCYQLGMLEEMFCGVDGFVRIHRGDIINVWHVKSFMGRRIMMDNGKQLVLGTTYQTSLDDHIEVIRG